MEIDLISSMPIWTLIALACGCSLVLGYLIFKIFPVLGLVDRPQLYGLKRKPIPYPGGLTLVLGFLIIALIFIPLNFKIGMVLAAVGLLAFVTFLDDRFNLSPFLRLFIQCIAAFFLVLAGIHILSITNPFGAALALDQWKIPIHWGHFEFTFFVWADLLTIFWVLAMVNAFNWIDGVPGVANGVGGISALVLLLLSMREGFHSVDQTLAISLSAIVLGLCFGFSIFNFPPPKMLMGDTGSMFLGFIIAVISLISGGKIATAVLVLAFPLMDFVWTILRRILSGKSPWQKDFLHIHHRFLELGFSERAVLCFFVFMGAIFGGIALLLHTEGKAIALVLLLLFMIILSRFLYRKN